MDRRRHGGDGRVPGCVGSNHSSLTGDTPDDKFQSYPPRLHVELAPLHCPDYDYRLRIPATQRSEVPEDGLLVDDWNSGSVGIRDRLFLRQPLLYLLQYRGDIGDRGTCTPQTWSDRRVRLLPRRLRCGTSILSLAGRILACSLQRGGLPDGIGKNRSPSPLSSALPPPRNLPHCGCHHLQEGAVACSGRFPRVFYFPCARCFCARGQLLSNCQAIHQLAGFQPPAFLYPAYTSPFGGHASRTLPMVALSAEADAMRAN